MRLLFSSILSVGLTLLLGACSQNTEFSGDSNTSETQNAITLSLTDSQGEIVKSAMAKVFVKSNWSETLLLNKDANLSNVLTINSDDKGQIIIPKFDSEIWVELSGDNESKRIELDGAPTKQDIQLSPRVSYVGNIQGATGNSKQICLEYSNQCTELLDNGDFAFNDISSGNYSLVLIDSLYSEAIELNDYEFNTETVNAIDSIWYEPQFILLEDFQDKDDKGNLYNWNQSGQWWIYHDSTTSLPQGITEFSTGIKNDLVDVSNFYFNIEVDVPTIAPNHVTLLALNLGYGNSNANTKNVFADIKNLDSIQFQLNTLDTINVFLQTKTTLAYGDENHIFVRIPPTNGWQTISLLPVDFGVQKGSLAELNGDDFDTVSNRVSALVFQFKKTGDYSLDDIKLYGIETYKLYPLVE